MPVPLTEKQERFAIEYASNGGNAGMLGTAKEVADARADAEREGGKVVDYVAVLQALRDLPKAGNDDAKPLASAGAA